MEWNEQEISDAFAGAGDFESRALQCCGHRLFLFAIDGLTASGDISEYIVKPVAQQLRGESLRELYENAMDGGVFNFVAKDCKDLEDVKSKLVNGFSVLLFPGVGAIAFETKTGEKRGISPPDLENTAKGTKDSFTETVRTNTSLIRRHLRTPELRIYETQVGRRSLSNVSVIWVEGLTNPEYVQRMKKRLEAIDLDGFISPAAVEEAITGSRLTAFPMLQYTERTDRFCQGLLDGRVGLFVDGIPMGYLLPVDIGYMMNSQEDLSRNFVSATGVRILRYGALVLDLLLPGLYIAMTMYHWEMLPDALAQVIRQGRENVPFSAAIEILLLLVSFELLQESGVHLPQTVGQSVSIIGGIVVGTVGVEAGLISSLALIAVSTAGVCGFVLPNRDLADAVRVWRFFLAGLAAVWGLWGIAGGIALLGIRMAALRSLGVPYLRLFESGIGRKRLKNHPMPGENKP